MNPELVAHAEEILAACRAAGLKVVTAESCTGGLVAAALTAVAGSSDVFERGFVTYSNDAKNELLGVPPAVIAHHGAVSEEVARLMAAGALLHARADVTLAITGIAGPGGGTAAKPVGLVHIAAARKSGGVLHRELRLGDIGRNRVRHESAMAALALLAELVV